jgi:hypothetical protein
MIKVSEDINLIKPCTIGVSFLYQNFLWTNLEMIIILRTPQLKKKNFYFYFL